MSVDGINLKGRVALVTGGSRGIGRATALRLAEQGADVIVNYLRDEAAARETVEAALQQGSRASAIRADVAQMLEAERLIQGTVEAFGRLDFLICNAGIWEGAPIELLGEEQWDRVLDINLKGTWAVCRAAVPQLKRQNGGRIVIVSSTAGQRGEANYSNYAASKGGQIAFTKSLAAELAHSQINVNAVAPGWVETEMSTGAFADPEHRKTIEQSIPLGRIATADDIALPIVFLCSDWARHITGEVLNVNGGSVLCG